ncbi:hypothetical protein Bbelb_069670 [Branchiostoma belcheri]|nr:hypothetical protein Bbelb_069670 [Branchiostoma belcheri]
MAEGRTQEYQAVRWLLTDAVVRTTKVGPDLVILKIPKKICSSEDSCLNLTREDWTRPGDSDDLKIPKEYQRRLDQTRPGDLKTPEEYQRRLDQTRPGDLKTPEEYQTRPDRFSKSTSRQCEESDSVQMWTWRQGCSLVGGRTGRLLAELTVKEDGEV